MKRLWIILLLVFLSLSSVADAGNILTYPRFMAIDGNGNPIRGARLYSYEAGTSTAKATYSNKECTVAHTNPVILDSNGQATIWLKGSYKLNLTTSSGAQVPGWPMDNIEGLSQSTLDYSYPSADAADHGVTGDSNTIKYYVDQIGSNKGTIYLRHDSGGVNTNYNLLTSLTIPANVTIKIAPGARIVQGGTAALTWNGPMVPEHPARIQMFSGFLTNQVNFGAAAVREIYPEWWGENTTPGTTDMSLELQSAFDSAPTGGRVVLAPQTYRVTSQLAITDDIEVLGYGATINVPAGFTDSYALYVHGTNTNKGYVTALIAEGASTISFTTTGVSQNDWLWIASEDTLPWSSTGKKAEFVQVKSVAVGSVNIIDRTRTSYTQANTEIVLQSFIRPILKGFKIQMDSSDSGKTALVIQDTLNALIEDIIIRDPTIGIYVNRSVNTIIRKNDVATKIVASSYGVLIENSINSLTEKSILVGGHHAIAHGGEYCDWHITVQNCILRSYGTSSNQAIDVHGNVRYARILNNTITGPGGINLRGGCDFLVEGNTATIETTFIYSGLDTKWLRGIIRGNYIRITDSTKYVTDIDDTIFEVINLVIENNYIISAGTGIIFWPAKSSQTYEAFIFRNNYMELPDTSGKYKIYWPITHNNMKVTRVVIEGNTFVGGDEIQFNAYLGHVIIRNNEFRGSSFPAINNSGSAERMQILENVITTGGSNIDAIKLYGSNVVETEHDISNNIITCTGTPILWFSNSTRIEGLIANNQLTPGTSVPAIKADDTGQSRIDNMNVIIKGNTLYSGTGIWITAVKTGATYSGRVVVSGNKAYATVNTTGIVIDLPNDVIMNAGVSIQDNWVNGRLYVKGGIASVHVVNNTINNGNGTANLIVEGNLSQAIARAVISGNNVRHTAGIGIRCMSASQAAIANNVIQGEGTTTGIELTLYDVATLVGNVMSNQGTNLTDDTSGTTVKAGNNPVI